MMRRFEDHMIKGSYASNSKLCPATHSLTRVLYPWSDPGKGFRGPSKHSVEMCTEVVSCLTNFNINQGDEVEEPEDGELIENDQNNLVLELSTDLDEEHGEIMENQQVTKSSQKKKPTIVSNTTKKGEKGKKLRMPNALGFIYSRL